MFVAYLQHSEYCVKGFMCIISFNFYRILQSVSCSVMSDSLQPHVLYPTRLLYPWYSSGKNTRVGCYSFLQGTFPSPGIKPGSPALQADSSPSETPSVNLLVQIKGPIF